MTEPEARTELSKGLAGIYGIQEGFSMAARVIPGIMTDFNRMLHECRAGESIQEEYRFEDGRAIVHIAGRKVDEAVVSYDCVKVTKVQELPVIAGRRARRDYALSEAWKNRTNGE